MSEGGGLAICVGLSEGGVWPSVGVFMGVSEGRGEAVCGCEWGCE